MFSPIVIYCICDVTVLGEKHFVHKEKQFLPTVINIKITGAKDSTNTKNNMKKSFPWQLSFDSPLDKKGDVFIIQYFNLFYNPVHSFSFLEIVC